jgi:branched-chain amino acid transport system substrate-binding protein
MRSRLFPFLAPILLFAALVLGGCERKGGDSASSASDGEAAKSPGSTKNATASAIAPQTQWKVGVIVPSSGALAPYGQAALSGVKMKAEEINAQGGVLGKSIELVIENNEGQTNKSAECLRKLAGVNEVLAVIGPITSTNCLAITRDAQKKGVSLITPTGTNDSITKDGDYIFRACFNDSFQGVAMAEFAFKELKLKSAVSFQDTASDYSVGLCKSFDKRFAELGGKVLPILSYKGKDTDFTPQLRQVREIGAEGLFIPGYPPELPLIVNQAKSMGLQVQLLGADGWDCDDLPSNAGVNAVGTCFSAAFFPGAHTPELDAFLAVAEKNGVKNPGSFEALGYDSMGLVAEAIRAGNPSGDLAAQRRIVRDQLHAIRDYKAATGTITMQSSGDPIKSLVVFRYENVDGKVQKALAKVFDPR